MLSERMSLVVRAYGRKPMEEVYYSAYLLDLLKSNDVEFSIFEDYPNESQGELLFRGKADVVPKEKYKFDEFVDMYNVRKKQTSSLIYQFEFKLFLNNQIFDCFLRINNTVLSQPLGNIEFDLFPRGDIINFGDYVTRNKQNKVVSAIEDWITHSSEYNITIKEAYIGISDGDFRYDYSKRIWFYYRHFKDYVVDVIRFIKNINKIELPHYLKEDYKEWSNKLAPYNELFIAKAFADSDKFRKLFYGYANKNMIPAQAGSLWIPAQSTENTLLLMRFVSEDLMFPVMDRVIGKNDFKRIINESLSSSLNDHV